MTYKKQQLEFSQTKSYRLAITNAICYLFPQRFANKRPICECWCCRWELAEVMFWLVASLQRETSRHSFLTLKRYWRWDCITPTSPKTIEVLKAGDGVSFPPPPNDLSQTIYTKLRKWGSAWMTSGGQVSQCEHSRQILWDQVSGEGMIFCMNVKSAMPTEMGKWNRFLVLLTAQRYKLVIHKLKTISTSPTCRVFAELSRPLLWELYQTGCVLVWSLCFVFSSLQTGNDFFFSLPSFTHCRSQGVGLTSLSENNRRFLLASRAHEDIRYRLVTWRTALCWPCFCWRCSEL